MFDLIIRNGQVVTPWGVGDWDIAVQGEKIVAVAANHSLTEEVGPGDRRLGKGGGARRH